VCPRPCVLFLTEDYKPTVGCEVGPPSCERGLLALGTEPVIEVTLERFCCVCCCACACWAAAIFFLRMERRLRAPSITVKKKCQ
jgi:hypothetical protein